MKTSHKHAEYIHAWADGAIIEKQSNTNEWFVDEEPFWYELDYYRVKPEPDVVVEYNVHGGIVYCGLNKADLKLTFDGKTGKLKSAEILK